jgi:hypothetical protein
MRALRFAVAAAFVLFATSLHAQMQSGALLKKVGDLKTSECPKAKSPAACRKDFDAYMNLVRTVERTKDQKLADRLGPDLNTLRAKYQSKK